MQNPEGGWDWLGGRSDLKSSGGYLTNPEMPNYFKETRIAKSHKLLGAVERHCLTLDFAEKMKESEADQFPESFGKFVRTIGERLNTDYIENKLGKSDVCDNARIIPTDISRNPGSGAKGKGNSRDEGQTRKRN